MPAILRCLFIALWLLAAAAPPAAAANFGLTGGDESKQANPSADDLFKGGDDGGFAPIPDGDGGGFAPQQDDGGSFAPTLTSAARAVELTYDGHAAADERRARISFSIAPDGSVSGTISIQSVCEPNIHLGGADLRFTAQLSGTWESKNGSIDGTWSGTEHFCGTDAANAGTLQFFRKEEALTSPVLHLRITGKNGRYGWNFPPTDRTYATATGVPAAGGSAVDTTGEPDAGTTGTDGQPPGESSSGGETGGKPESGGKPGTEGDATGEIDPDRVTGIIVLPSEVPIGAGGRAELPQVYAIQGDTADKVPVPPEAITWNMERGLSIEGGEFEVSSKATDGDRLGFDVRVALSLTKVFTAAGVVHVTGGRLGSIEGTAYFYYRYPDYKGEPRRPLRATVELQRTGGGAPLRVATTGPDGHYRFDRLPEGTYQVVVTGFQADSFPQGYRLKVPNGPWIGYWAAIPEHRSAFKPDPDTAQWDHTSVSTEIALLGPDYDARPDAVSGRVLYHGEGVAGVTVKANRLGSDGGEKSVTSGKDGRYTLEIKDMEPGTYWLRAEKFVVPRWAGPDDLLDVASARDERSVLFTVPFFAVDRISIDIDVLTRNEIFGGERTPEQPTGLP
jgi:hypothetical protein